MGTLSEVVAEGLDSLIGRVFTNTQDQITYRICSAFKKPVAKKDEFGAEVIRVGRNTPKNIGTGDYFRAFVENHSGDLLVGEDSIAIWAGDRQIY